MSSLCTEKDLEERLVEVGKKLQKPPTELDQLVPLLEVLESSFGRVEQSPSKSMTTALCPSMNSLVSPVLLKHSDKDVRLSVATCLSEITRITAPDAPYDDDLMKEIFKLIVSTFEDLSDAEAPSFDKRVLILETVAKVRSCVLMLDLECDDLIMEMFCHFIKTIREDHAECVFASMEGIMTVVFEESDDIPSELLMLLLTNMKTENLQVSPVSHRLVEAVMGNCVAKLKPYVVEAVKSSGLSEKAYSKIIAEMCEGAVENENHTNSSASKQNLPHGKDSANDGLSDGKKEDGSDVLVDVDSAENSENVAQQNEEKVSPNVFEDRGKSTKEKSSNGSLSSSKDDSTKEGHSLQKKSDSFHLEKGATSSEVAPDTADHPSIEVKAESDQETKSTNKAEPKDQKAKKAKGRQPSSLKSSSEGSDGTQTVPVGNTTELPKRETGCTKESEPLPSDGPITNVVTLISESEKEIISETVASSSAKSQSRDSSQSKRGRKKVAAHKANTETESEPSTLPMEEVGKLANTSKEELPDSSCSKRGKTKVAEHTVDTKTEAEPSTLPIEVSAVGSDNEKGRSSPLMSKKFGKGEKRKKSTECTVESSPKMHNAKDDENIHLSRSVGRNVKGIGDKIDEDRRTAGSGDKKSTASKNSANVGLKEGQTSIKSSSIKKTPGRRPTQIDGSTNRVKAYDESLVGSQIKVYWPLDKKFYGGTVVSFDPVKKKHKVSYADGDEEELVLSKERWEYVEAEKQEVGPSSSGDDTDSSDAKPPPKKTLKTANSTSRGEDAKNESSPKKRKESLPTQSKSITPKSGAKLQSNGSSSAKVKSNSAISTAGSEIKGKKRLRG